MQIVTDDRPSAPATPGGVAARVGVVARTRPDAPALRWDSGSLTYAELWHRVDTAAEHLDRAGIGPHDKVAVLSPNDHRVVVATLALMSIGAAWLPVNSRDSASTITALLDHLGCDALIAHPDLTTVADAVSSGVPSVRGVLPVDHLLARRPAASPPLPARTTPVPADERDLAAIFPTGGTTGRPKGVAFTHDRLTAVVDAYARVLARPDDVYLAAAPLTHVGGRVALSVLASGGTVLVLPAFEESAVLGAIERYRVTTLTLTPTMLYRLTDAAERGRYDTSSLRALVYGGAPAAVGRIRQAIEVFGPVLEGGYGQTEAPMFITRLRPEDHVVDGRPAPESRLRSVGRATEVSEVRIVDDEGRPVPVGQPGRVLVRGDFTMSGYYRDPQATAARTEGDHRSTGDIGFLDEDGFLTLVGRETDLIITGGFNVYPAEVENVIASQPGVRECAVFGLPDERWGESVTAVVVPAAGARLDPEHLRRALRPLLGGVKTPKRIDIAPDLPRNDNGKILKRLLVEERLTR
ncbi:class I adenylate-forming enzyme family protein [Blastococcus sp. SYSU D00669]